MPWGTCLSVTNRGLHSSASVNAQQNRITTDWADTATSEVPSEAFYLYDVESGQWFSPTYLPLRDKQAEYSVEFGVDGTATFRMERPEIATELTVFVPPHEPTGVYLLDGHQSRQQPAAVAAGPLLRDRAGRQSGERRSARSGLRSSERRPCSSRIPATPSAQGRPSRPCRAGSNGLRHGGATSSAEGRAVAHPMFVADGHPSPRQTDDRQPVAALLTTLEIPADGSMTVAVVLGPGGRSPAGRGSGRQIPRRGRRRG